MSTQPIPRYTPEQYLAMERAAETKHEYFDGEIFAMSGASRSHVLIAGNLAAALLGQLRDRPCNVYPLDMRVRVSPTGLFTYPDVIVVCGDEQFADDHEDTLLNPTVIFEVLSPSTESYDRGKKFRHYRTLDSLREYVLVSQEEPRIEQYVRQPGDEWLLHDAAGLDAELTLRSVDATLRLADVFNKIEFPPAEEETLGDRSAAR